MFTSINYWAVSSSHFLSQPPRKEAIALLLVYRSKNCVRKFKYLAQVPTSSKKVRQKQKKQIVPTRLDANLGWWKLYGDTSPASGRESSHQPPSTPPTPPQGILLLVPAQGPWASLQRTSLPTLLTRVTVWMPPPFLRSGQLSSLMDTPEPPWAQTEAATA